MSTRNPAPGMTFSQLAAQQLNQARNQYAQGQAAQQLNQARNLYAPPGQGVFWSQGQAAQQHQYLQNLMNSPQIQKTEWMIAGEPKTFTEFVNTIWPEDSAEKTFFLLKYQK